MLERRDRLRKLAPVMGRETADLLSVAGDVDPRLRRHTDALIALEAYRRLGQTFRQDEILLPPPSPEQARGPIPLGRVHYNDKAIGEFGLFEEEINRHTAIVGASGAGKTVAAFHLVLNLVKRGVRVVVFDPKRSYRSLLPLLDPEQVRIYSLARPEVSPYVQNFFLPPEGVNPELYHNLSQVVMSDVLYGGHGSYAILSEAVRRLRRRCNGDGGFTMRDVAEEVNEVASAMRKGNRMGDWSATAIRMTSVLANAPIGPIVNVRENHLQQSVEQARLVIFECDMLSVYDYVFFSTSFLLHEFYRRLNTESPDRLEVALVFEEASRMFSISYEQETLKQLVREVREKGIGLVFIAQSATDLKDAVFANCNNLIVMRQINKKDIDAVAAAVAFEDPAEKRHVARLKTGEAIVRVGGSRYPFPFVVRTEDIAKTVVTDAEVTVLAKRHLRRLKRPIPRSAAVPKPTPTADGNSDRNGPIPVDKRQGAPEIRAGAVVRPVGQIGDAGAPNFVGVLTREAAEKQDNWVTAWPRRTGGRAGPFKSKEEEYRAAMAHLVELAARKTDKPVTYLYSELGLSKAKGTKIKKMLLDGRLARERKSTHTGRVTVHLELTEKGRIFLADNANLLSKKLVAWETRRFGGPKSRRLEDLGKRWAKEVLGAVRVEAEAGDGFGGKWDLICTGGQGKQTVVELVTGESKAHEAIHVQKALSRGLPIVCLCWNGVVRERVRRYLSDQGIREDGVKLCFMTARQAEDALNGGRIDGAAGDSDRRPDVSMILSKNFS